jgi:hydroxymethylpyrimidine/phosphomethylpyrimidine kinase
LIERVLPLATVATPNLPEARGLAGLPDGAGPEELAEAIAALGPKAVIVTGGHTEEGDDVLFDGSGTLRIGGPRYGQGAAHGSGCTHSSALAAFLARGSELADAARWAREIAAEAVGSGLSELGKGPGPVDVLGLTRR